MLKEGKERDDFLKELHDFSEFRNQRFYRILVRKDHLKIALIARFEEDNINDNDFLTNDRFETEMEAKTFILFAREKIKQFMLPLEED